MGEDWVMQTEEFVVGNVKCQGCVQNIRSHVEPLQGVESVAVDISTSTVRVTGSGLDRAALAALLAQIGYPEKA